MEQFTNVGESLPLIKKKLVWTAFSCTAPTHAHEWACQQSLSPHLCLQWPCWLYRSERETKPPHCTYYLLMIGWSMCMSHQTSTGRAVKQSCRTFNGVTTHTCVSLPFTIEWSLKVSCDHSIFGCHCLAGNDTHCKWGFKWTKSSFWTQHNFLCSKYFCNLILLYFTSINIEILWKKIASIII